MCILKTTDVYDAALRCRLHDAAGYRGAECGIQLLFHAGGRRPRACRPGLLENTAFNPPKEDLANCEYYEHLEKDILQMYEDAWMKVKIA